MRGRFRWWERAVLCRRAGRGWSGLRLGWCQRVEDGGQVGAHVTLIRRQTLRDLRLADGHHTDMRQPFGHIAKLFLFIRRVHKFALAHKAIDALHQLAHISALLVEIFIMGGRRTGPNLLFAPLQQPLRLIVVEVISHGTALI